MKRSTYMPVEEWDKNWSVTNNRVFQYFLDQVTSYYRKTIRDMFVRNHVSGKTILELGCGTGSDTIWMLKKFSFSRATVVDFSEKALAEVQKRKGSLPISLIRADIMKLRVRERFNLVHSGFVIEHFYGDDRQRIIRRHADFVKDDGWVFIQAPGKNLLSLLYSKTINKLNHIEELMYTKSELEILFRNARLQIVELISLFGGSVFFILARRK